jgi:coenzyme F420 hydrogenase subunit beta
MTAITMTLRVNGAYAPVVDQKKCVGCGSCMLVCPGYRCYIPSQLKCDGQLPNPFIGNYLHCYFGHSTNNELRTASASGGLITQLLIYALEKSYIDGCLVTKMSDTNPLKPEPFIAKTKKEILSAAKSKYCPVPANVALTQILNASGKFAVVGLPCHIQGARKAELNSIMLKNRIVLHFGLVCNHAPTFLATRHLLKKLRIEPQQILKIEYRGRGHPGKMTIFLKDGQEKSVEMTSTKYWGGSFSLFFYNPRCTVCEDKMCESADISFMDAWLPEFKNNTLCESIVVVRTKKGMDLLMEALSQNVIELNELPVEKIISSQLLIATQRRYSARMRFLQHFRKDVPVSNRFISKVSFTDYLKTFSFPFRLFISGRPALWFIIDVVELLLNFKSSHLSKNRNNK